MSKSVWCALCGADITPGMRGVSEYASKAGAVMVASGAIIEEKLDLCDSCYDKVKKVLEVLHS